jgi:hypothetical protein
MKNISLLLLFCLCIKYESFSQSKESLYLIFDKANTAEILNKNINILSKDLNWYKGDSYVFKNIIYHSDWAIFVTKSKSWLISLESLKQYKLTTSEELAKYLINKGKFYLSSLAYLVYIILNKFKWLIIR